MKTEKRFAKKGEKILVTCAFAIDEYYKNGDILTVEYDEGIHPDDTDEKLELSDGEVYCKEVGEKMFLLPNEYVVIVEE